MNIKDIKAKVKTLTTKLTGFLPQSLPQGQADFNAWFEAIRVYKLPTQDEDSLKFMLGSMLMHLGQNEDRKPRYHFVKTIRAAAAKQVGAAAFTEVKMKQQAAQAAALEAANKPVEATTNLKVVANENNTQKG